MSRMTHFSPKEFDCGGGFLFRAYFSRADWRFSRERERTREKKFPVKISNTTRSQIQSSKAWAFKGREGRGDRERRLGERKGQFVQTKWGEGWAELKRFRLNGGRKKKMTSTFFPPKNLLPCFFTLRFFVARIVVTIRGKIRNCVLVLDPRFFFVSNCERVQTGILFHKYAIEPLKSHEVTKCMLSKDYPGFSAIVTPNTQP